MFEVMETMNINKEYIQIVKSMYNGTKLRFKANGTKSNETVTPTNGIAQGCPLSPCLYLLCLQGLLSLIQVDSETPGGMRGIRIPDAEGQCLNRPQVSSSAFADDLGIPLNGTYDLQRFKEVPLRTYEEGSGARNSWDKTCCMHIGDPECSLPTGWREGIDVACIRDGIIRYLGIYLGAKDKVATEWMKKTTKKIIDKANVWRERRLPATREGRCVALRNSILAQAWYLVENQMPPNVEEMTNAWREEAWCFMGGAPSPHKSWDTTVKGKQQRTTPANEPDTQKPSNTNKEQSNETRTHNPNSEEEEEPPLGSGNSRQGSNNIIDTDITRNLNTDAARG